MAEYIDRERVIQEIKDMDNCGCITRSVNHVCENMRYIPTADVIERSEYNGLHEKYLKAIHDHTECLKQLHDYRSKIDKAIEEIDFLREHRAKYITEDNKICIDSGEVLKILKAIQESSYD